MCAMTTYTAILKKDGDWWIGWVEEIPGVSSQGKTREELMENLHSALQEALERSAPFVPSIRENGRIGPDEPFSTKDLGGSARGGHVSVEQGRSRLVR